MTASTETPKVVALHGTKPMSTTPQTRGMERRPGIDSDSAGAKRIWMGHVTCLPNELGPPHHHGGEQEKTQHDSEAPDGLGEPSYLGGEPHEEANAGGGQEAGDHGAGR